MKIKIGPISQADSEDAMTLTKPGLSERSINVTYCHPAHSVSVGSKTTRAPRTISSCDWQEIDPQPLDIKKPICKKRQTLRKVSLYKKRGNSGLQQRRARDLSLLFLTQVDTGWVPRAPSAGEKWRAPLARRKGSVSATQPHAPQPSPPSSPAKYLSSCQSERERRAVALFSIFLKQSTSCHFCHDNWPKDRSDFHCQALIFLFFIFLKL